VSDSVPISVDMGGNLLVSLYLPAATGVSTWHSDAFDRTYAGAGDHTGDTRYLAMATRIAQYLQGSWDPGTCGGGMWWDREHTYKNAVTSGLYLRLTAAVHRRTPGDTVWLQRARTAADWYLASGMINADGLVNDGLTTDCRNNGGIVWTYNQGLLIGGLHELWLDTEDPHLLSEAHRLADAAVTHLTRDGVLTESCDIGEASCDDNQKQFKGILVRYLAELGYRPFLARQWAAIWSA
ncbi:glycoside hydrolase family 76 protein, partial [Kibdelosporangium lantanae]